MNSGKQNLKTLPGRRDCPCCMV